MKGNLHKNLTLVVLILLAVVLGCSDSENTSTETVKKSVPPEYIGVWTGQDGSLVTFRNDWSGDYKSGGKSVSGGSFEIDEAAKEIRFSLFGFDAGKYKIDEPPKGSKMKLDGMEYRRTGGFDASREQTTEAAEVPTEDDLRPLVYNSLVNFNRAIQGGDFTEFYETISEKWQSQTSAAVFNKAFENTIKNKSDFAPKSEAMLDFTPKPLIEDKAYLMVTTKYATVTGKTSSVRLSYFKEDGEWKLFGIELSPKPNTK